MELDFSRSIERTVPFLFSLHLFSFEFFYFNWFNPPPAPIMECVRRSFYLPRGELVVTRPGPVEEQVAFLFCLLTVLEDFSPEDIRSVFELQFPSHCYENAEKACARLPPSHRAAIHSKYSVYPKATRKEQLAYDEGVRDGAKRMKRLQEHAFDAATPFILYVTI